MQALPAFWRPPAAKVQLPAHPRRKRRRRPLRLSPCARPAAVCRCAPAYHLPRFAAQPRRGGPFRPVLLPRQCALPRPDESLRRGVLPRPIGLPRPAVPLRPALLPRRGVPLRPALLPRRGGLPRPNAPLRRGARPRPAVPWRPAGPAPCAAPAWRRGNRWAASGAPPPGRYRPAAVRLLRGARPWLHLPAAEWENPARCARGRAAARPKARAAPEWGPRPGCGACGAARAQAPAPAPVRPTARLARGPARPPLARSPHAAAQPAPPAAARGRSPRRPAFAAAPARHACPPVLPPEKEQALLPCGWPPQGQIFPEPLPQAGQALRRRASGCIPASSCGSYR